MPPAADSLPENVATLEAMVIAAQKARLKRKQKREMRKPNCAPRAVDRANEVAMAKLRHERFGQSSERRAVLEQLEHSLAEMEEDASQAEAAAQIAVNAAASFYFEVTAFEPGRQRASRCPSRASASSIRHRRPAPCCVLHQFGEDITETLEVIPRQWKVIQHMRERFSCRSCDAISQPPAPPHPIARGRAEVGLLAQILFSRYGFHLRLNRQSAAHVREGIDLDVSTLADLVDAAAATPMPLVVLIRKQVFAAERIQYHHSGPC